MKCSWTIRKLKKRQKYLERMDIRFMIQQLEIDKAITNNITNSGRGRKKAVQSIVWLAIYTLWIMVLDN